MQVAIFLRRKIDIVALPVESLVLGLRDAAEGQDHDENYQR